MGKHCKHDDGDDYDDKEEDGDNDDGNNDDDDKEEGDITTLEGLRKLSLCIVSFGVCSV